MNTILMFKDVFSQEAEQQISQYKINYTSLQEQKMNINEEQVPLVRESEEISSRLIAMAEESHVINVSNRYLYHL